MVLTNYKPDQKKEKKSMAQAIACLAINHKDNCINVAVMVDNSIRLGALQLHEVGIPLYM